MLTKQSHAQFFKNELNGVEDAVDHRPEIQILDPKVRSATGVLQIAL